MFKKVYKLANLSCGVSKTKEKGGGNSFMQYFINKFEPTKSILAGLFVGLGGIAFLSVQTQILGSLLFSIGLLVVLIQGYYLYTGKIGFINSYKDFRYCLSILVWNIIGAMLMGIVGYPLIHDKALEIVKLKLSISMPIILIKSIGCGILIYIAVELYQKTNNYLAVIIPIMTFILCGFEHCIANIFYITAANIINLESTLYIIICILGNSIGSLLISLLENNHHDIEKGSNT